MTIETLEQAGAMTEAQPEPDFIVVGSGAGGGPLACNLARAGFTVLLMEAGSDYEDLNYQVPAFHGKATEDPGLCWDYFVRHYADDDQQRRDSKFDAARNGVLYPRSGTLGGCTAHNAMITVYPHNSDWDRIAEITGDPSWNSDHMRTYYERLERCEYVDPPANPDDNAARHGFGGWLTTNEADPTLAVKDPELVDILVQAAAETFHDQGGHVLDLLKALLGDLWAFITRGDPPLDLLKKHFDPNDWRVAEHRLEGLALTPLATHRGRRTGTREYIKQTQKDLPDKLLVKTNVLVSRVLLDADNRATGVAYLAGPHLYRADPNAAPAGAEPAEQTVHARREVILAAGAFNSPQLLKLSGIGPPDELARFGIPVRVPLAGVGENLQDRYELGLISELQRDFTLFQDATFEAPAPGQPPDPCLAEWMQSGTGVYTTNGVAIGMIKRSAKDRPDPDLFIFGLPGYFSGYFPGYSRELETKKDRFTWALLKAHTRNTAGRVTLRSRDPRDTPEINFHYFQEGSDASGEDLDSVVEGVEFVRTLTARTRMIEKTELLPGGLVTDEPAIRQFVKDEAWGHHASCSNKMGPAGDPLAVVDSEFRVHGTKDLRVVDASVFPHIPGFFIALPIYMISEKASDVILAAARS